MFDDLFDLFVDAADLVDDVAEEVTGIRPIVSTIIVAGVVVCAACRCETCKCKKRRRK
jgi:hypothetical protein